MVADQARSAATGQAAGVVGRHARREALAQGQHAAHGDRLHGAGVGLVRRVGDRGQAGQAAGGDADGVVDGRACPGFSEGDGGGGGSIFGVGKRTNNILTRCRRDAAACPHVRGNANDSACCRINTAQARRVIR